MKKEIWKPIKEYEGLYEVSNLGRVRSLDKIVKKWDGERLLKGRVLKENIGKFGYRKSILTKNHKAKTLLLHRLVANTFIPNPENKPQVNHIDGNKGNNNVDNLEWVTASENVKHAYSTELKNPSNKQIEKITQLGKESNKPIKQLDLEGNTINIWDSMTKASKDLNINLSSISMCCNKNSSRKRLSAGGFKWEYIEIKGDNE